MKKFLLAATLLTTAALSASAQYSVVMQRSGQNGAFSNCVTLPNFSQPALFANSWSVGGVDPFVYTPSGPGLGAKTTLAPLVISRNLDGCGSPQLQAQFLSTTMMQTYTLTQFKMVGGEPLIEAVITLTDAFLDSYQIGGTANSVAQESIGLNYQKLCLTNYSYSATGASSKTEECFDQALQKSSPQVLVKGSAAFAK